ncbi:ferrochelatase [bacterium BMS3Abin09]|nr:ferrochelatase [bacterium BMS3Abin09]
MTDKNQKIIGIVLLNLGGPDSLQAVRPFLYNLFSDREIIRLGPPFLQKPLAWLISTLRSKKATAMYNEIGGKSPILDITNAQAEVLEKALNTHTAGAHNFKVYIGMRYWHPFMKETVNNILKDGVNRLVVLSLYPHYSKATTGSSVDDFKQAIKGKDINIKYIEEWYDFPAYIDSLADLIAGGAKEFRGSNFDILYSAHSLPQSFIDEGDPYLDHINMTIKKVNERLAQEPYNITNLKWRLSFQSKTGPVKWLEPSTKEIIIKLSKEGCKNLFIIPISFVSDHIETLYEIDIQYKALAEKNGINLKRCASLNTSDKFISALKEIIIKKGLGDRG